MTNIDLSSSYISKAGIRLKILDVLLKEKAYSDVVREAQEIVELSQKAILRKIGIDPPKWHDVSNIIIANIRFIPEEFHPEIQDLLSIAKWLRGERELSFYGDIDFIPTEEYSVDDANKAIEGAKNWFNLSVKICAIIDKNKT